MKTVEFHSSQTLFLARSDFVHCKFSAIPIAKKLPLGAPTPEGVEVSCLSPLEVGNEEAEEAVEILLNKQAHAKGYEEGLRGSLLGN